MPVLGSPHSVWLGWFSSIFHLGGLQVFGYRSRAPSSRTIGILRRRLAVSSADGLYTILLHSVFYPNVTLLLLPLVLLLFIFILLLTFEVRGDQTLLMCTQFKFMYRMLTYTACLICSYLIETELSAVM